MRRVSVFQWEYSLKERLADAEAILEAFSGERVPVVVERVSQSNLQPILKKNHAVPVDWNFAMFVIFVRKWLRLKPEESIVCIVNETIPPMSATMGDIYKNHAQEDKFLYFHYCEENVFG
uniref:Autophagy-related protein n=1 Tax=Steinernema glaseri TaxID=37863 RepID=A0A1I7ZG65_9BILA